MTGLNGDDDVCDDIDDGDGDDVVGNDVDETIGLSLFGDRPVKQFPMGGKGPIKYCCSDPRNIF